MGFFSNIVSFGGKVKNSRTKGLNLELVLTVFNISDE